MGWKRVLPMEERIRFVLEYQDYEKTMSALCRQYGVSRKTGYKWLHRYEGKGLAGLRERSHRSFRCPHETSKEIQQCILEERLRHPTWGPKKIRERLKGRVEEEKVPAASTIGGILDRAGLIRRKRRRRKRIGIARAELTEPRGPNHVWAIDFKGYFRTGDGRRCDPLTVSDLYSRYVVGCDALLHQKGEGVERIVKRLFREYGLPTVIRCDNGSPFASRGAAGLSRLSVWWVLLGIMPELIDPGHPEQNGIHERMHRTLKEDTAKPPSGTRKGQQRRFNRWRREYNYERPHEALGMDVPASYYHASGREYPKKIEQPWYPDYCRVRRVRSNGEIKWKNRRRFIGDALVGNLVGVREVDEGRQHVYFGPILLGALYDNDETGLRPTISVSRWAEPMP